MKKSFFRWVTVFMCLLLWVGTTSAQGPHFNYFYNPATEIPWASLHIKMGGGSSQKIPFMLAGNFNYAPCGSEFYSRDISVNAPVVFAGDGIVQEGHDSYAGVDVKDKFVMICYDCNDSLPEKKYSSDERILQAIEHEAAALILFSCEKQFPVMGTFLRDSMMPDIPMVTLSQESAEDIFISAGYSWGNIFETRERSGKFETKELIVNADLKIDGEFDEVNSDNFEIRFRKDQIPVKEMKQILAVNDKSVRFLTDLFQQEGMTWKKSRAVYFRDYDIKKFYTLHSGSGLSCEAGTFLVHRNKEPDYALAVHENTHSLVNVNWGKSSSFMDEGIAKYAEAMATDPDANHRATLQFLKEGKLFRLNEIIDHNIGTAGMKTTVAYPASGSLIHFLVDTYGMDKVEQIYKAKGREEAWEKVFGKPLSGVEDEWWKWLRNSE